jgi:hypothetical protein
MFIEKIDKRFFQTLALLIISTIGGFSYADDSCSDSSVGNGLPFIIQQYDYPEDWFSTLSLNTNKDTVPRNGFIEAWVNSSEWGCPPYQWNVIGMGFHFNNTSGPTVISNKYEEEKIQLWSDNSACGTATVTVTNQCKQTASVIVKSSFGNWVQACFEICPDYVGTCGVHDFVDDTNKWKLIYACFGTGCEQICGASASWFTHQGDLQRVWRYDWQCE